MTKREDKNPTIYTINNAPVVSFLNLIYTINNAPVVSFLNLSLKVHKTCLTSYMQSTFVFNTPEQVWGRKRNLPRCGYHIFSWKTHLMISW